MKKEILDLVFPNRLPSIDDIEKKYPSRCLVEGEKVTRTAPSPTGLMHVGTLWQALINERLAHQSKGTFIVRIEDTDQKRLVDDAVNLILKAFDNYALNNDEGPVLNKKELGAYGPYFQSERRDIYQAYVRKLLNEDKAYLCFCTEEENKQIHDMQSKANIRPGYYGTFAKCRKRTEDDVLSRLQRGDKFVVRFKSPGYYTHKIVVEDVIRGKREFPENDLDIVIMKADGLPTYHFAHLIDDHLMGTTHVIRGDEWLSSYPLHIQLFQTMGWKAPKYVHTPTIQKLDENGNRRKLSKRLDPEASVGYFAQVGYPKEAVLEYLLNLANSNFEDWRRQNSTASYREFPFSLKKLNVSGALFDFVKLDSISRDKIGQMQAHEIYEKTLEWASVYDDNFAKRLIENLDYMYSILNIEREGVKKVRKDIVKWSDVKNEVSYFFDDLFLMNMDIISSFKIDEIHNILGAFIESYSSDDTKDIWFDKIKQIAGRFGFATDIRAYNENPTNFNGSVADVAKIIRIVVTGREQSPDLWAIMNVMGKERVIRRLLSV